MDALQGGWDYEHNMDDAGFTVSGPIMVSSR
jgi:hypothetical protein